MKTATAKTPKTVSVIAVYKFTKVSRICFEVLSSDEITKYNTCFNGDAQHASCNCDGHEQYHKDCYHINQLRPQAQAYFESRQPTEAKMDEMAAYYQEQEDETPGLDAAEAYLASLREQAAAKQVVDKEWEEAKKLATAWQNEPDPTIHSETYLERLHRYEREREERKRDAWKERSQFGGQAHKMEVAPSGRLVPMR